jgi:glycosyltransferase involved in cell wall biosynthesis
MMLGTDVSGLSTTAATAAAQGLSIVVPVYNEAAGLALLHQRLGESGRKARDRYRLACEVVYVDDGSTDATLAIARGLAADALDVQVVSLSRNFGKEAALMAGLDHARRGAVLFMDGDGQHPPDLVEKLVGHWIDGGYDVVYTAKAHRDNESFMRRLAVHGFYALINWGARQKIPEDAGDFRLLSPRAAAALRQLPERNRFFKGLASWIGFRQIRVDYEPAARAHGVTTFSPGRLVGLSIEGLTSFSVAPLRFASLLGVLLASVAFLFGLSILWETWMSGKSVPGYPSLVVGLMTIGGVQLIMIGIVGEYIGKILSELKARPIYFVAEHSEKRAERSIPAPARGPPPNERRRAAAPHLAVRRRLRYQSRRQPRHSRPDRARPPQCHIGDGGRPAIGRDEVSALQASPPTASVAPSACTPL